MKKENEKKEERRKGKMRVKHERERERVQRGQEPRESVVETHSCILSIQSRRWFVLVPFHCTQLTSGMAMFNFPAEQNRRMNRAT